MENKLGDLPQEMIDDILRSTDLDLDFHLSSSDFAVFDGHPSPASSSLEAIEVPIDAQNEEYETFDVGVGVGGGGDVTEMQAVDPNTLMPPVGSKEMTLAFLNAVDLGDGGLTFAVLAEEEEEEGELVEFPEISTVVEEIPKEEDEEDEEEEEEEEKEDEKDPPSPTASRKRSTRTRRRDPSEPPRKRGRKPLYPPGTPRPSRRRPRKVKLYEREAFQDPAEERKRVNALNAKLHRQKKKEEKEQLEEQLKEVRRERDLLRTQLEQMRQREQLLLKELEAQQQQQATSSSRRFPGTQSLTNVC